MRCPRETEKALLERCVSIARSTVPGAQSVRDGREASLLLLAATLLKTHFPVEGRRIEQVVAEWGAAHPDAKPSLSHAIEQKVVQDIPRFRNMLEIALKNIG
jgi:hypothetical protein